MMGSHASIHSPQLTQAAWSPSRMSIPTGQAFRLRSLHPRGETPGSSYRGISARPPAFTTSSNPACLSNRAALALRIPDAQ